MSSRRPFETADREAGAVDAAPAIQPSDDRIHASTPISPAANETEEDEAHRCFICLVDEATHSLPTDWATPCTCTMEGHQICLLTWVNDLEAQGKRVECPQCKSPIKVLDRWDPVVNLGETLTRRFSKVSPLILAGFAITGTFVANVTYGVHALEVFAGSDTALEYLTKPEQAVNEEVHLPWALGRLGQDARQPDTLHMLGLSLIAPALVLNRTYLGQVVMLPASLLYGVLFADSDSAFVWPPSPHQALALFPTVKAVYFQLHGLLWQRIDRNLRFSQARDALGDIERIEAVQDDPARGEEPEAVEEEEEEDQEEEEADLVFQIGLPHPVRAHQGLVGTMAALANYLAGALVWPSVSYGMGKLLQAVLPKAWVTRPASAPVTGLLQERWGRSLVGGCLFVVIKDAFHLYVKYRRAIIRPHRRIQNVNRRTRSN